MSRRPRSGDVTILGTGITLADPSPGRRRMPPIGPPRTAVATGGPDVTRVLGLDLAMQRTGWALLVGGQPVAHGTFDLPRRRTGEPLAGWLSRRADDLVRHVRLLVATHLPQIVGFEYPDTYRRAWSGGSKGREFEVSLALGRVQGFLIARWSEIGPGVRLEAISTSDAKRAVVGRVDANKDQIRWGLTVLRGFDLTGWGDDESDACAVAIATRELL